MSFFDFSNSFSLADFLSRAFNTFNCLPFRNIPTPDATFADETAAVAASAVLNLRKPVPLGRLRQGRSQQRLQRIQLLKKYIRKYKSYFVT